MPDSSQGKDLAGCLASDTTAAVDNEGFFLVEFWMPVSNFGQRDQDGAGNVRLLVFLGLSDIE